MHDQKVIFFGCPMDSDEREASVTEKLAAMSHGREVDDPYAAVMGFIRNEVDQTLFEEIGSLEVPDWLCPVPPMEEKENISVGSFVKFIDSDGCLTFSEMIGEHVVEKIYPQIPCMVAVDHSLTGGIFKRLANLATPEAVSLVVLDGHTDAMTAPLLSDIISYDTEANPDSLYDADDPYLKNRPASYNASSFLHHLMTEGAVLPKNLYIIGIGDYPPKHAFRIKDNRIKRYTGYFRGLKKKGVTLITKKELMSSPSKVRNILKHMETTHMYVSVDMDVGAGNALNGVRFKNRQGLNEKQIYRICEMLRERICGGVNLIGMDLTEFNARAADPSFGFSGDRTYRIAANLIRKLCFGLDPAPAVKD
ncbi:MAG: arginase family protein [Deltaproteobacteria bacterium]|nr:arginase family protein [Deltaproteobacteria bacterium]